jgi:threonine dehydrogenase-like Zn-dependent dehydrogenase
MRGRSARDAARSGAGDAPRIGGAEESRTALVPEEMKVASFRGGGRVELRVAPLPEPGRGEVRIRLEGCGVCPSNLPPWEGRPWFQYPLPAGAPGHEGWGVVDAVGDDVSALEVGDRVATLAQNAYAEYAVAGAAEVVPLPRSLEGLPFPGEPLGCAMNIFRRAGIRAGQSVAIVGVGFLGALLTGLASRAGAQVVGVSRRPFALEMARHYGAAATVQLGDPETTESAVRGVVGPEGCDRVIEATGKAMPLDLAAKLTRVRGRLVVAGYHQDGVRCVDMQLWNWKGLDVVNAHERDPAIYLRGVQAAVRAVAAGTLDPAPLYTHTFPLDGLDDALRMVAERPDGFLKALVVA